MNHAISSILFGNQHFFSFEFQAKKRIFDFLYLFELSKLIKRRGSMKFLIGVKVFTGENDFQKVFFQKLAKDVSAQKPTVVMMMPILILQKLSNIFLIIYFFLKYTQ
jgi:hypothetical protein